MKLNLITKTVSLTIAVAAIQFAGMATANALTQSIPLFNTGVNAGGGLLGNATADPHFTLISAPGGYTTAYTGNGNEINGGLPWVPEGPNSRWINPSGWLAEWLPIGNYVYRTTFDLSGFDPNTASLQLSIASDNSTKVYLNGGDAGISTPLSGFSSFSNYAINSGFVNGLNTLDFEVNNASDVVGMNPTGFRVELSGYATVVPEPATATLLLLAGGFMFASRRKASV
jgi:hypothetical protein